MIAYYTKDTPYEQEIEGLKKSCSDFGIMLHTKGFSNQGSWQKNTALKPIFIGQMLELCDSNIVYVDADARIRQYPIIFDELCKDKDNHIAVHYRNNTELLSGTIYLQNCEIVKDLVNQWIIEQQMKPRIWDQKVLQSIVEGNDIPITVYHLPPAYTQIFDIMKHYGKPVIEHMQASRRLRGAVQC